MQINEINILKENQIDLDWLMDCIDGGHGLSLWMFYLWLCLAAKSSHIIYVTLKI